MKKPVVILFTITNSDSIHTLGIYNLKAYALKHYPHSPKPSILIKIIKAKNTQYNKRAYFFKMTKKEIRQIAKSLISKNPQVIGFSCWLGNSDVMRQIAHEIKIQKKDIKLIFGGTETYHNFFFDRKDAMEKEIGIDVITRYDGEGVFLELLEAYLSDKRKVEDIKGISYRKNGKIILNEERTPMILNDIPSPYVEGIFKIRKNTKEALVENSRGCPYRCSYCSFNAGNWAYCRYLPYQRLESELKFLLKKRLKFITLLDSNFNVNTNRSKDILKLIVKYNKHKIDTGVFYNASRQAIDEEMAILFQKSGITLNIGVQSINPMALKAANRQTDISILEQNLRLLDKYKVKYALEFIYGLPEDTYLTTKQVINWVFRFNATNVYFYRLCVLKGTPYFTQAKQYDLHYEKTPPYYILKTHKLSPAEINKLGPLLDLVSMYYHNLMLRKLIYQINALFHLDFITIFEQLILCYKAPNRKQWSQKYIIEVSRKYFDSLFKKKSLRALTK